MKKLYLLLLVITCVRVVSIAQTMPAVQSIPYQQDFSSLASASTTYPDGWQGWTVASSTSTSFRTDAPTGDKSLTANGTASSTAGATYNYNGKVGFLNSGSSGDQSLALALNTTGKSNVQFAYDIMTIRNPYGGSNSRINEVILQYRIGITGSFTNITGTEYQNNTINQQSGTDPQNVSSKILVLPSACDNQSIVQLRWISREVSGAGSRPGFAIDNISAGTAGSSDTTAPYVVAYNPANHDTAVTPSIVPSIQFSEAVNAGTGNIILYNGTNHTQQVIAVNSTAVVITGNTVTLNVGLKPLTTYAVSIDSAALADAAGNAFAGTDSSAWTFTTASQQLSFDFNNCTPSGSVVLSGGFTQYNSNGAQTWACTTFGQTGNAVQINGFANGSAQDNDDWLISPAFDFSGFKYPLLSFASRSAFAGPSLRLMVSTSYDGKGNPADFTWTEINGRFPDVASDVWTITKDINLQAFKDSSVYVAFLYHSSVADGASRWTIDNISLVDSDTLPAPGYIFKPTALSFDYVQSGNVSSPQVFRINAYNLRGDVSLTAPAGFALSTDSVNYQSTVVLQKDSTEGRNENVFVRFQPSSPNIEYNGVVKVSSGDLSGDAVQLSGSSLRALKVVNWNTEWFGSPVNGPTNDSLQQQNVLTVLRSLNADIFALAEVVDTSRLKQVTQSLGGYNYIISDFSSYADSITDVDYAGAQKLAFVYKTSLIKNLKTYGVLRKNGSSDAYYNWSSGRFPYLMEAEVNINGDVSKINFVLLHSKANTGTTAEKIEAYQRRKAGAEELKDTLDKYYPYKNFIVLGDFNDALNKTITTELAPDTTTSYISFVNDSADYKLLTLPLSLAGDRSTVGNENVIDNVVASNEMGIAYVPASAHVLQSVADLVSNYGNTTSDHYPVVTRYDISYLTKPVDVQNFTAKANPSNVELNWVTTHEINSKYFIVERSADNRSFIAIDTIAGQKDTRVQTSYKTFDNKPLKGKSWYRLKQLSLDSSISYSPVQEVKWKSCIKVLVLGKWITIELCGLCDGKGEIQIIDIRGRICKTIPLNSFKGYSNIRFNSNLPLGIYFIRIVRPGDVDAEQVLIPYN